MRALAFRLALVFAFLIPWEEAIVFPGLGTVTRAAGLATGVVWLVSVLLARRVRRPQLFHIATLAFFGWNAASILWSIDPESTLTRVLTYSQLAVLVLLVWDVCRQYAQIEAALQAYVLGSYLSIVSVVSNFLSGSQAVYGRYAATGSNPNTNALILALGIGMAWHLATSGEGRWVRRLAVLNYLFAPAALFAISLTGTRLGLFVAAPGLLYAVLSTARLHRRLRVPVLAALVAMVVAMPFWIPPPSRARLATTAEEVTEGDLSGRLVIWRQGLDAVTDHPLLGVGSNAFPTAVQSGRSAHNSYLAVLVELGVTGFLLFVGVLAVLGERALHLPRGERAFWLAILLSWALGNSALTWTHAKTTWLLLGLLIAHAAAGPHRQTPSASRDGR